MGELEALKALIDAGCDVNDVNSKMTLGYHAQFNMMRLMCACGSTSSTVRTFLYLEHAPALHVACFMGNLGNRQ